MPRLLAAGAIAGVFAGCAVGFLLTMPVWWWLTDQPWWPVGETLTWPLVWAPFALAGGAVGALCGWLDHRKHTRKKKP